MASLSDIFGFSSRPDESDKPRKWPEEVAKYAIDPFADDAHEEIIYSREFRVRSKSSSYYDGYNRFYLAGMKDKRGNITVCEYHHNEGRDKLMLVNERLCDDPMEVVKLFRSFEAKVAAKADAVEPTWQNYRAYARDNGIHFDDNDTPYRFDANERLTKTTYLNKRHLDAFYGRDVDLPAADTWQGLYARIGGRVIDSLRSNWKLVGKPNEYTQLVQLLARSCKDFDRELSRVDVGSARSLRSLCNISLNVREHSKSTGISSDDVGYMTGFFVLVFRMSAVAKIVRDYPDFKDGNINTDKINALETANSLLSEFVTDLPQREKDAISRIAASGVADPCRDEFLAQLFAMPQTIAASPLYGFENKVTQLRLLEVSYLHKFIDNNLLEARIAEDEAKKTVVELGDNLHQVEEHKHKATAEYSRVLRRFGKLKGDDLAKAVAEFDVESRIEKVQGLINEEKSRSVDLKAQLEAKILAARKAAQEAAEKAAAEKAAKEAAEKLAAEEAAKNPPPPPKKRNWLGF